MYYDLLVRIKNAELAGKNNCRMRFSEMDFAIAKLLVEAGYVKSAKKRSIDKKHFLEVELMGKTDGKALHGIKFVSKPGRRSYIGYRHLKPIKQGYGLGVLSTPKGVMTNIEAKKNKVGGEYLFEIW